jgi:hypothetical protein
LTCAALLCSATTQNAHAEWVLDHMEAPGNITYTAGSAPGIAPVNISEPLSDHNMWGQAGSIAAPTGWSPQRVEAFNEVDGQVRAVFRWESFEDPGMPGGQAPPEYVTFKIDAGCFAEASRDVNENTLPHNATGEVAEAKIMDVAGSPYPQTHKTTKSASTTQYKTVAVENGYATSPWVEIKASAKIGSNRYTTISMFEGETMEIPLTGTVGIGWQITFSDPREKYVLISSGIETSYRKASEMDAILLPNVNEGGQAPNKRLNDGSIIVDSAVTWGNPGNINQGIPAWIADNSFTGNTVGFPSNCTYEWQRTGDGVVYVGAGVGDVSAQPNKNVLLKLQFGSADATFDPDLISAYAGGTKSTTLKVKVTDPNDGFIANTQYDIHWHLPAENVTEDTSRLIPDSDIKVIAPDEFNMGDSTLENGILNCSFYKDGDITSLPGTSMTTLRRGY